MTSLAWWVLAALAAAARGAEPWACPAGCECGGADLTKLTCAGRVYRVREDGYVEVDCQGSRVSCSDVPRLPQVTELRRLELTNCSVSRGAGGCVAGAAGGAPGGPPALYTRDLVDPLSEDALLGLENVQMLFMHGASAQETLPPLRSLPALREYRLVQGRGTRLTPSLPPSLRYLELTDSGVRALSREAFEGLAHLETLNILNNQLEAVDDEDLEPLVSLRQLAVSFNPVRRLRVSRLAALQELAAARVALPHLREGDVSNMTGLRQLTIKSQVPLRLHPRALSALPALTSLSVTQSGVTSLPADLFLGSGALLNLSLAWNNIQDIPDTLFSNMSALERLDLSHNALTELRADTFHTLVRLQELLLDYNHIHTVASRALTSCVSLRLASLAHNALAGLPARALPAALRHLRLHHNQLSWHSAPSAGDYSDLTFLPSPFNSLFQLEVLDLSYNNISHMFGDFRHVLIENLRHLDLSHNSFTWLSAGDTQFMNLNITVDLRYNNITGVEPYVRYSDPADPSPPAVSQRILLSHNPYSCDCQLFPLLSELSRTAYDVSEASCRAPAELRGAPLSTLDAAALTCPLPPEQQPPACACLYRPARARYECSCAAPPPALPDPREDGVPSLALTLTARAPWPTLPDFVNELNVSGVGYAEFDYNVSNVRSIDLSNNELGKLPLRFLEGNYTLFLRGNPIQCDCWNAEFIAELNEHADDIRDYDSVTCSDGGRVGVVDAGSLCDVYRATVVGSTLALVGVLVAVLVALCWRYQPRIREYLATVPGLEFLLEEEEAEGKEFDVFVSFSHEDFPYIRDVLMPVLDREYKVCVHYREWEVGQTIPLQIHRSVLAARRTVVLLSRSYVRSRWALAEFREAGAHGRLVPVLLEPVARQDLPPDLRDYLAATTYLEVGDSRFWDKLRRALPRRPLKTSGGAGDSTPPVVPPTATPPLPAPDPKLPAIDVILNQHGQLVNRGYVKDV